MKSPWRELSGNLPSLDRRTQPKGAHPHYEDCPPIVALRVHMVPARQAVTAQPACPHARWQWGLRSAQGPGCSVGCRGPEPRNEPFRTRPWVPGGSRPPRKLLSAHPLHAYTHLPTTIPHPRALSTFPSSLPPPPSLRPLYSCLTPLIEHLQHSRLPFHTHFLLLPTQALNSLGEKVLVYTVSTSPTALPSHLELNR